jgi:hypothetical protein
VILYIKIMDGYQKLLKNPIFLVLKPRKPYSYMAQMEKNSHALIAIAGVR